MGELTDAIIAFEPDGDVTTDAVAELGINIDARRGRYRVTR
jgi:hypothetical protein